ncbi:TRAP transporter large permease subunit [Propionivibrio limicola]|uniref:TRAP transporter large permease subunit n=1 Tax=Propionivibrio limicola TaxID=167645 RepID=UPI001291C25D|nr:TRAP transporter large permease subunit [Propionivibrio limicola]
MTILIFLAALMGGMIIGMPIAFSLLGAAVALMFHLDMFDAQIIAQNLINGTTSFTLMAVPFFLLAGEVMNAGGLSQRIVKVALALVGHKRGGLGYVAIVASVLLASLSGSAVADAAALATLLVPMMMAAGHSQGQSCGLVSAGGIIGPIIPPSIPFILFGVAGGVSISKLFLAGIVPGILMGGGLAFTWWFINRKADLQLTEKAAPGELTAALKEGVWALMLPAIIIFGLKFGIFTPTEAAVVAAVYALFVALVIYRELKITQLFGVLVTATKSTGIVMFLVAAAMTAAWLITIADLPGQMVELLTPLMGNQTLLMLAIVAILFAVGCVMDLSPIILILTPVLLPVAKQAGINEIYFGVVFIVCGSVGLITPPVGTVLNVVAGATKSDMTKVVKGVSPFLLSHLAVLTLMILFPAIVTVPAAFLGAR